MTNSASRTIGYLRVSRETQDLDKNRADILTLANREGLGRVEFVEETAFGRIAWRKRKIAGILDELRAGDTLIVSELSRLGRSMLECMEILSIASDAGIRVHAIKGGWRLDETIQSRIIAVDRLSRWGCGMAASNATAASAARFLDKLVRQAPFSVEAVQVDGGSEFMAEFEAACGDRNITLAVLPPKSPKQNGRVERMQATLRNEFDNVQDTAVNVSGLRPLIDEYMELYNGWRPHDSLDGMTPDEYLESRRIGETPPLHMS